ncbi:MAG TPA: lipase maturation factor family protein [Opitutaceae bacterium]|nr:lipase maturation factor family protein [Opitutaceae bacterium]
MLRAVGVVYLFIFAGIIVESAAMVGPEGVAPIAPYLAEIKRIFPGFFGSLFAAPSLFWLNASPAAIAALEWTGLLAAVAVVLNLWPRLALAVCWIAFLSFVETWADFSSAQLDRLMLETALLCIPFAPAGVRPGLGAASPPRRIAVFAVRWLLFRVMFESGVVKLISNDPHWRNLTAMDVMYETAPSPTILGYWAHQLPHAFHVGEIALTFLAEIVAPLAAVFGGRRGRWFAFAAWGALQVGIQLTCNFGWLNTAALGLGLLLLDDTMLVAALRRCRAAWADRFQLAGARAAALVAPPASWARHGLRAALALQFALTLSAFAVICLGSPDAMPAPLVTIAKPFAELRSANGYSLYADFDFAHHQVDFEGSNDGGRTWRTYEYRHVPQRTDRVAAFLAPWYPRFEAAIQIESWTQGDLTMLPPVAAQLLRRSPPVLARFARDPFPDRPPTVVRMRRYRLAFTDSATLRRTGQYWRKEPDGDFQPAMYLTPQGEIAQFNLAEADAALQAKNFRAAFAICEQQFQLGNLEAGDRLAEMYARGLGGPEQTGKAFALFADLAARGELPARLNLGLCYEYGVGTPVDYERAAAEYRRAAEMGSLAGLFALGSLSASERLAPASDVEGLAALLRAGARSDGPDALVARIRAEQPELVRRMMARMKASDVVRAQQRARELR